MLGGDPISFSSEFTIEKARQTAIKSLSKHPKTVQELRERLLRDYDKESVELLIHDLICKRILDDEAFATAWCFSRQYSHPRSSALIRYELLAKGVDSAIALDAVAGIDDDKEARKAGMRYLKKFRTPDRVNQEGRLRSYLQRRGFDSEVIQKTIKWLTADGQSQ